MVKRCRGRSCAPGRREDRIGEARRRLLCSSIWAPSSFSTASPAVTLPPSACARMQGRGGTARGGRRNQPDRLPRDFTHRIRGVTYLGKFLASGIRARRRCGHEHQEGTAMIQRFGRHPGARPEQGLPRAVDP